MYCVEPHMHVDTRASKRVSLSLPQFRFHTVRAAKASTLVNTHPPSAEQHTALPVELIEHILTFVAGEARGHTTHTTGRQTLAACALVCRAWYSCTVASLYTEVRLPTVQSTILLARTLRRHPRLAWRVRSLYLPGAVGNAPKDPREALSTFARAATPTRKALPPSYSKVIALCDYLQDLHLNLAPTDEPIPCMMSLLQPLPRPTVHRLWISFNRRLGFNLAAWSAEGILCILAHPALSKLKAFSLANVLITFGSGVPLPRPKYLPSLHTLRLQSVQAFGPIDGPIEVLVQSLRSTLTTVDIVSSNIASVETTLEPVAGSIRSLWLTQLAEPSLGNFAVLTDLRICLASASRMIIADLPPQLKTLAIDIPDTLENITFHPARSAMQLLLYVLPAHPTLRHVRMHIWVRRAYVRVHWAFAILSALAAEQFGLQVGTELAIAGGAFYARPPSPPLPIACRCFSTVRQFER